MSGPPLLYFLSCYWANVFKSAAKLNCGQTSHFFFVLMLQVSCFDRYRAVVRLSVVITLSEIAGSRLSPPPAKLSWQLLQQVGLVAPPYQKYIRSVLKSKKKKVPSKNVKVWVTRCYSLCTLYIHGSLHPRMQCIPGCGKTFSSHLQHTRGFHQVLILTCSGVGLELNWDDLSLQSFCYEKHWKQVNAECDLVSSHWNKQAFKVWGRNA